MRWVLSASSERAPDLTIGALTFSWDRRRQTQVREQILELAGREFRERSLSMSSLSPVLNSKWKFVRPIKQKTRKVCAFDPLKPHPERFLAVRIDGPG
jgi:hypothetical protein